MKTMKILNAILISSLLLGCDNKPQSNTKNEASEHNGRTNASTSVSADNTGKVSFEAKKSELGRVKKPRDYKHSPKASQDAQIVAFYRDNDSKDLTPAYQMFKVFYAVLLEHPSYYNIDNPEAAILRRFIKNAGFDENKINWCIASGEFDFSDPYQIIDPSSLAVVVNIKHSSEELRELILDLADETKQFLRNDLTIVPETTTGEKALQISLNNPRDINISPYIASLDDELIVITGSRRILRKQIALYRNGAQEKKEVSEILSDEDVMLGAVLVNSGKTVNNFISVHEQEMRRDSEVDIALEAIESGVDKIRINPGNIGDEDKTRAVVEACKEHKIPIRIGVNGGSLEKELLEKWLTEKAGRKTA